MVWPVAGGVAGDQLDGRGHERLGDGMAEHWALGLGIGSGQREMTPKRPLVDRSEVLGGGEDGGGQPVQAVGRDDDDPILEGDDARSECDGDPR